MMKHRITRDANLRSLLGSRSSNIVRKPAAKISQDQPMDGSKSPNSGTLSQGQAGPPLAWVAGCTMYLFHGVVLTDEDRVEKTNESNGGLWRLEPHYIYIIRTVLWTLKLWNVHALEPPGIHFLYPLASFKTSAQIRSCSLLLMCRISAKSYFFKQAQTCYRWTNAAAVRLQEIRQQQSAYKCKHL